MRMTVFSDYTLRVLIYLGLRRDRRSTISEIAAAYGISQNHLMKVVHYLAQAGYVETVRGRSGGMRLAQDPDKINIGKLVRATEEDVGLVECFQSRRPSDCRIERACALRDIFGEAMQGFFVALDRYTLADLLRPKERLVPLLFVANKEGVRARRVRRAS